MKTLPSCLCIFGLAGLATAGGAAALMDQIGSDDGSSIDTSNMFANQIFEASFSIYDIGCVDDFDNAAGMPAGGVELVVGGWNGYAGIDGITGLSVNFYTDENSAGASLVGDVASEDFPGAPVGDPNWGLAGYDLVGVSGMWNINTGMNYVALIPSNEFGTNGQTGAAISFDGDLNAWQCNPAGGFGFGPIQMVPNNIALRVIGGSSDPCDIPLPACNGDITGPQGVPDGDINVDDVLGVIGTFGQIGDGTSRPMGDVVPLPFGNCEVDVDDLLEVIGQFGGDCLPRGACCFGVDGCTEDVKEGDCAGEWLGEGSACSDCVVGACCFADGSCDFVYEPDCDGAFQGQDVVCADVICVEAPANTVCSGAIAISDGDTGVDTTTALTDGPPDFTLCDNFDVEQVYNDLWYSYVASCTGTVTVSTCDTVDFDSRLAVYDACDGSMLVCNDDCGGANNGLSSELALDLNAGDSVVIRLGSFAEGGGGTGVLSVSCVAPAPGACCLVGDCLDDLYPADCADFGGEFQGNGTSCATVSCIAEGNTCDEAGQYVEGANPFDTSDATDSGFGEPDDTQCAGTYLDWTGSPDTWGYFQVPGDGTLSVSLCDAASYDTSLVLYEGADCTSLTQVACNGDSTVESGCQSYYSGIYDHPVSGGSTIYIRIGGWQAATGPGTCTITFTGAGATGACCLAGDCLGEMTSDDCAGFGGTWYANEACADVDCPVDVSCNTGNGESPTAIDGAWTAGTSDTGAGYLRAADCSAGSVADATVYGLALIYSGGWGDCSTPDAMGVGVDVMDSSYNALASASASFSTTNLLYAGIYTLHGWTASPGYAGAVGALSAYSMSGGEGECWLLWMSADAGTSVLDDGTGWVAETFGLNYCITE
ncbi:MAG: hypothetical protein QF561_01615 [Phycisphaerales bacterium]|jgi:hypothetical protein|nr:hypothetical protein [Phycisphaerales bacterium]